MEIGLGIPRPRIVQRPIEPSHAVAHRRSSSGCTPLVGRDLARRVSTGVALESAERASHSPPCGGTSLGAVGLTGGLFRGFPGTP